MNLAAFSSDGQCLPLRHACRNTIEIPRSRSDGDPRVRGRPCRGVEAAASSAEKIRLSATHFCLCRGLDAQGRFGTHGAWRTSDTVDVGWLRACCQIDNEVVANIGDVEKARDRAISRASLSGSTFFYQASKACLTLLRKAALRSGVV
jgi:hypothetical protein